MTMHGALVLRPEPGNARTAALLTATGVDVLCQPLFAVTPVAWTPPDSAGFDALLLTSANAVRHAGGALASLSNLPALAVGQATAVAARAAGLTVALVGDRDALALVDAARSKGFARLLHLAGRDRVDLPGVEALTVYRSDALPIAVGTAREWQGRVVLLHSVRAVRQFVALVDRDAVERGSIAVAVLSTAVRDAAGQNWAASAVAHHPTDAALVACAVALIDPSRDGVDKQGQ